MSSLTKDVKIYHFRGKHWSYSCLSLVFLLVCRAAGGEIGQPVQGDVCGPASQQPRGIPVRRLQFSGQGLGLSQLQGQTY